MGDGLGGPRPADQPPARALTGIMLDPNRMRSAVRAERGARVSGSGGGGAGRGSRKAADLLRGKASAASAGGKALPAGGGATEPKAHPPRPRRGFVSSEPKTARAPPPARPPRSAPPRPARALPLPRRAPSAPPPERLRPAYLRASGAGGAGLARRTRLRGSGEAGRAQRTRLRGSGGGRVAASRRSLRVVHIPV